MTSSFRIPAHEVGIYTACSISAAFLAALLLGWTQPLHWGWRGRGWSRKKAGIFFSRSLILLAADYNVVFLGRVISQVCMHRNGQTASVHIRLGQRMDQLGVPEDAIVLVNIHRVLSFNWPPVNCHTGWVRKPPCGCRTIWCKLPGLDGNNPKLVDLYQSNHRKMAFHSSKTIGTMKLFQIHYEP
jgi:hypothetical protein